jgi:hypothetical protein
MVPKCLVLLGLHADSCKRLRTWVASTNGRREFGKTEFGSPKNHRLSLSREFYLHYPLFLRKAERPSGRAALNNAKSRGTGVQRTKTPALGCLGRTLKRLCFR